MLNFHKYLQLENSKLKSLSTIGINYAIYSPLQRASETGEIGLSKIIDENSNVLKDAEKYSYSEAGTTIKHCNDVEYVFETIRSEEESQMTIQYSENAPKDIITKKLKFLCTEIIGSFSDVGLDKNNYKSLFPDVVVCDKDFDHGFNLLWKNYPDEASYNNDSNHVLNNDIILEKYRPHMIHKELLSDEHKIITVFTHSNFISNYLEYVLDIPAVFGTADLSIKSNDEEISFGTKFKEFYPFVIDNTNIILLLID